MRDHTLATHACLLLCRSEASWAATKAGLKVCQPAKSLSRNTTRPAVHSARRGERAQQTVIDPFHLLLFGSMDTTCCFIFADGPSQDKGGVSEAGAAGGPRDCIGRRGG